MIVSRGDVVLGALPGDFGKPRPVLIVQTDLLNETHATMLVCPITSHIGSHKSFRMLVEPATTNGLLKQSEVMVDKVSALAQTRITRKIGTLGSAEMRQVEQILKFLFQLV